MPERLSDELVPAENEGVNLLGVYRSMLRIVECWDETQYTESNSLLRQTAERELDTLANPASAVDTTQD